MGNIENTAVNELIERVSGAPRPTPFPRRSAAPRPATPRALEPSRGAAPVTMPVAAPFETTVPMPYPMVHRPQGAARRPGRAAAAESAPSAGPDVTLRLGPARLHQQMHARAYPDREQLVPTFQMRRPSHLRTVVKRLVVPAALLVSAGIAIGAFVAFSDGGKPTGTGLAPAVVTAAASEPASVRPMAGAGGATAADPAPALAVAEPPVALAARPRAPAPADTDVPARDPAADQAAPAAVAAAPEAAPVATGGAGASSLVEVRIDSVPSGATVMLVDRGRTQLVGDTPVETAVDPSREYDLVFTYAGGATHMEHLDARTMRRVRAVLEERDSPAPAGDSPSRRTERAREAGPSAPSRRAAASAAGEGTLMISSKPPCEIVIDGRSTGLITPQRAIALSAGNHRVTLVNREKSIRKTLTVPITADTTEKVIQDLMR